MLNTDVARTLYRSVTRHPLSSMLSIGGLAIGIATFLVLYLYGQFERGYDRQLPGSERIWVVERSLTLPGLPPVDIPSPPQLHAQLQASFPQIETTRLQISDVVVKIGSDAEEQSLATVDLNFFSLFPYPAASGQPKQALSGPDEAVVTRDFADRYLGSGASIGAPFDLVIDGSVTPYRVVAILERLPPNVSVKADVFVAFRPSEEASPTLRSLTTFLKFPNAETARQVHAQMPAFWARHPDPTMGGPENQALISQDIRPLHGRQLAKDDAKRTVVILELVGVLALVLAIVNYVNLATARADLRAREIAIRKTLGASRASLIALFLSEAIIHAAVAALIGLAMAELALSFVNSIGGATLSISYMSSASIIPVVLGLILFSGLTAGLYPAIVLSAFLPARILASATGTSAAPAGARLRRLLVMGQFVATITLTITTVVLATQAHHLRVSDLGFERDGLLLVRSYADDQLDEAQRTRLRVEYGRLPGIESMAQSGVVPTGGSFSAIYVKRDDSDQPPISLIRAEIGPGFFDTYGARLIAGRLLGDDFAGDDLSPDPEDAGSAGPSWPANVVVNRSAADRAWLSGTGRRR